MRALVTGATGFAGSHLCSLLEESGDEVTAVSRSLGVDLGDAGATRTAVTEARPEVVFHLAAQAHVGHSWEDPLGTLAGNLTSTVNLLEAVRAAAPGAVVVVAVSGEVYGPPDYVPTDEAHALRPQNPYAVSKAATDLVARFYFDAHGLRTIRARAFNHSGPGQEPTYAIASFCRQLAAGLVAGDSPIRIVTGNPDTRRDYTDVRDVVRAYRALAERGESGEAYNICSGRTASAAELVAALAETVDVPVEHVVDPALVRAHEVMEVHGAFDKLRGATGWVPTIPLATTLSDSVSWWREQLA